MTQDLRDHSHPREETKTSQENDYYYKIIEIIFDITLHDTPYLMIFNICHFILTTIVKVLWQCFDYKSTEYTRSLAIKGGCSHGSKDYRTIVRPQALWQR